MTIEGKHLMHYSRHSIFVLQSAVSFKPTDALARTLEKNQEEEWQESWKARSHSKRGSSGIGFAAAAQFIKEGAFV
jgi:post-segregation antitoxin (ccd killing protein)